MPQLDPKHTPADRQPLDRLRRAGLLPLAPISLVAVVVGQGGCGSDPPPAAPATTSAASGTSAATTSGGATSTTTTTGADVTSAVATTDAVSSSGTTAGATTGTGTTGGLPDGPIYAPCTDANEVGSFLVANRDGFSKISGTVNDKTRITVPVVESESEGCRLLVSQGYTCTPECAVGTTCSPALVCETNLTPVNVGTVDITGLGLDGLGSVSMMPTAQTMYQAVVPAPPFPAFAPGATVSLNATGSAVEAFSLQTKGVDELVVPSLVVPAAADMPLSLSWTPASSAQGKVHIDVDVGHHGGSPAHIECDADDDGEFQIPQPLVSALFDYGVWGFPKIDMVRRSVASTTLSTGCVELVAESAVVTLEVSIDGVVSCNAPEECAATETCQFLRCVPADG